MPMHRPDRSKPILLLEELLDGYHAQLELYRRWLALSQQARARVDDAELDDFLRLHGEKDEIGRELRAHEEKLQRTRELLRSELQLQRFTITALEQATVRVPDAVAFSKLLTDFRELLEKLGAAMRELESLEQDTEQRLRRRLRNLRGELKDVHSTRRATRAYTYPDPASGEARFIDHKG